MLEDVELIILGNGKLIASKEVDRKLHETCRWESIDPPKNIVIRLVEKKVVAKSQKDLR